LSVTGRGCSWNRSKREPFPSGRITVSILQVLHGTFVEAFSLPAQVSFGVKSALYCALLLALTGYADEVDYSMARARMVDEVRYYATLARDSGEEALDEDILQSLGTVERHEFVPARQQPFAYENRPLPIGHGQTISQPYVVALMTDLIEPDRDFVVLEIGTGSGYQAAILAQLVTRVYSIEIIEALADEATARLANLGYSNVTTKLGDGYDGWVEHAPYDAIVVTAAASHVPPPLIQQLKPGGRMIIPIGGRFMTQQLLLLEKTEDDEVITRQIAAVRFVPLTRER
jgi:protein-L-isoaspartate(D-aspartate) O-methyltransferase